MPKKSHIRRRRTPNSYRAWGSVSSRNTPKDSWAVTSAGRDLRGKQETVSEGHRWPPVKPSIRDEGGPFFTTRSYLEYVPSTHRTFFNKTGSGEFLFSGHLLAEDPGNLGFSSKFFPSVPGSSNSALDKLGASAIAQVNPINSVAELSTALGEIVKDGVPRIPGINTWERRLKPYLGVAEDFLNYAFGLAPLLEDIKDTTSAIRHHALVLKQYERDAGKVVRRSFKFPLIKEESQSIDTTAKARNPALGSQFDYDLKPGTLVVSTERTIRRWFDGAFTYYLPSETDSWRGMMGAASSADKLFGINPDPQTLWELTPWSWAIDWFTNAGDVIQNISDFVKDGSVLRYGYMMEESITKVTYTMTKASGLLYYDSAAGKAFPIPLSAVAPVTVVTVTKKRQPANPYGFGVTWEGLSNFQLAILAALGITRRG